MNAGWGLQRFDVDARTVHARSQNIHAVLFEGHFYQLAFNRFNWRLKAKCVIIETESLREIKRFIDRKIAL